MKKKKLTKNQIIILISLVLVVLSSLMIGYYLLKPNDESSENNETKEEVLPPKDLEIVDLDSTSRPFAVMINNHDDVRPYHMGLQDAYILYEIVVEGGISRYMALFKDQDTERIHGIRSARHYYVDYALENDAYFIHWGSSPQGRTEISSTGVNSFEVGENHYAYRDYSLPVAVEHMTYSSIETLKKAVASKNYREETNVDLLLNYDAYEVDYSNIEDVKSAKSIDIYYSTSSISSFKYDEENKVYLHSVDNEEHIDYITKEQYYFKNIITYQINNYTLDDPENKGRQEIENIGSGTGYLITNGEYIPIKWSKSSNSAQTVYTYVNGEEIVVNDGNTYIAIQPEGQKLNIN